MTECLAAMLHPGHQQNLTIISANQSGSPCQKTLKIQRQNYEELTDIGHCLPVSA